jgi:hypothetical protein
MELGLNSALDIQITRHTELDGNYKYTVHEFNSALCLIKEISYTNDKDKALKNAAEIEDEIEEIDKKIIEENKKNDLSRNKGCLGGILLFLFLPSAFLFVINWII